MILFSDLLSKKLKIKFFFLILIYIFSYFFEIVSLSLVFPIIKVLSDGSYPEFLINFLAKFKIEELINYEYFFLILLSSFFFLFILRTIFMYAKDKFQYKYYLDFQIFIRNKLLKIFYSNFNPLSKQNKSSETITLMMDDVENFASHNQCLLSIIPEVILTCIFSIFLFILDYRIFILSFSLLCILSYFYVKLTNIKYYSISFKRRYYYNKKLSDLQKIFFGFIELKLAKKINFFFKSYMQSEKKFIHINIRKSLLNLIPKLLFEFFLVLSVTIILFATYLFEAQNKIALIGTFVVISFRLFPKVSLINTNYQNLKTYSKSVHVIKNMLKEKIKNQNNLVTIKKWNNIIFKNINFKYDRRIILKNVFFEIFFKKSYLIYGDNGSGKSTLAKILAGLNISKTTKIILDRKIQVSSLQDLNLKISYMPQKPYLFDASIYENVTFNKNYNSKDYLFKNIIKAIGVDEIIKKNNIDFQSKIGEEGKLLSGGEGKKICLARALYLKPQILILVELLDSIDYPSQIKIIKYLRKDQKNLTLIMITHNKIFKKFFNFTYNLQNRKLNKIIK